MVQVQENKSLHARGKSNTTLQRLFTRMHVSLYRLSGGAIGGRMDKSPVLLLTTTGRKSGKQYTTPVLYLADGAHWVVVASYAGSPVHPTWWLNLKAHTRARVQVGRHNVSVTAIQATPEERARLWPLLIEMYPQYLDYEKKTHREFPIVILSPEK